MISFISSWAEQVIIAVIIGTIIEIILPKGNTKKYIKTVIGVYILYTIISPVITLGAGSEGKLDYSEYEKYFSQTADEYKRIENEIDKANTNTIENTYKQEIAKQMKKDLEELEITVQNISLDINLETGEITKVNLIVYENQNKKNNNSNIEINKVQIGNNIKEDVKSAISNEKIEEIKKRVNENYGTKDEEITVNSI